MEKHFLTIFDAEYFPCLKTRLKRIFKVSMYMLKQDSKSTATEPLTKVVDSPTATVVKNIQTLIKCGWQAKLVALYSIFQFTTCLNPLGNSVVLYPT